MARKYARGAKAVAECQRCGKKMPYSELLFDGYVQNLRVCRECWDPRHPQEMLQKLDDPVALWRPAPENLNGPTAPVLSGVLAGLTIELTWTESESGVSHVNTYLLYRSVNGGAFTLILTFAVTRDMFGARTNALEHTDTDVMGGSTYSYYVVGRAVQGGDSPDSNTVTFTPETFFRLLEDGSYRLLEDGTSRRLLEAAP